MLRRFDADIFADAPLSDYAIIIYAADCFAALIFTPLRCSPRHACR